MLNGSISCDVDTLASIYKGYGLRREGGYTYAEFAIGMENFSRFLEKFNAKATLFVVGNDFRQPQNIPTIKAIHAEGHEIANHSLTHAQGFRLLSIEEKETELAGMEELCQQVLGQKPVGFRSPGWNIGDDALSILKKRGYLYDSSIHPSSINPLLKFMHWKTMSGKEGGDRTTLGHLHYMTAPITPYFTAEGKLGRKGKSEFIEFPVTVLPIIRLPFFATFTLATGLTLFKASYKLLRSFEVPIQYQFHLSDFVDYNRPELANQLPADSGVYVPQSLRMPLEEKMIFFDEVMSTIAEDYSFKTLAQRAEAYIKDKLEKESINAE